MLNAYAAISTYYRVLGETGPALDCLRKATAIAPRDSGFVLAMAAVMLQVRCLDDALQLTNRALEMINKGTCLVRRTFLLLFYISHICVSYHKSIADVNSIRLQDLLLCCTEAFQFYFAFSISTMLAADVYLFTVANYNVEKQQI